MMSVSNLNGAAGFLAGTKIGIGLKPVLPFFDEDGHAHLCDNWYGHHYLDRLEMWVVFVEGVTPSLQHSER